MLRVLLLVALASALACGGRVAETPPSPAPPPPAQASLPGDPHPGQPPPPPGGHRPPPNSPGDPFQGVPETAPDVQVTDLDGASWSLKAMTAEGPVLLILYKTECPATELAMPAYNKFRELYGDGGFSILAIAQNSKDETERFRVGRKLNYPQALDADGYAISKAWNVRFTPTLALVGQDGKVKKVVTGWHREGANEVARELATLLGEEYKPISQDGDGLPPSRPG